MDDTETTFHSLTICGNISISRQRLHLLALGRLLDGGRGREEGLRFPAGFGKGSTLKGEGRGAAEKQEEREEGFHGEVFAYSC